MNAKNPRYPKGAELRCRVTYLVVWAGPAGKSKREEEVLTARFSVPKSLKPAAAFSKVADALGVARDDIYGQWLKLMDGIEQGNSLIHGVFLERTSFWTDEDADEAFVTGFVRSFGLSHAGVPGGF
jgi:hypothetical protein